MPNLLCVMTCNKYIRSTYIHPAASILYKSGVHPVTEWLYPVSANICCTYTLSLFRDMTYALLPPILQVRQLNINIIHSTVVLNHSSTSTNHVELLLVWYNRMINVYWYALDSLYWYRWAGLQNKCYSTTVGMCCTYARTVITYSKSIDQSGKVANPARGQLNRENEYLFLHPLSRMRIRSRETGSAVPSRVSLLIFHTQAESGAYSRDSSRFPRRRPFIYFNRHTPSGQSRVYRITQVRTDGVHCRESAGTGPVVLKVVPVTSVALTGHHGPINTRFSLPHPLY